MSKILENIKLHRNEYYNLLMSGLSKYVYREERYNASFSLVVVYSSKQQKI